MTGAKLQNSVDGCHAPRDPRSENAGEPRAATRRRDGARVGKLRVAIAGVGNCASALLQGIEYYRGQPASGDTVWGLMHLEMGGVCPGDIEVVAAFDIEER